MQPLNVEDRQHTNTREKAAQGRLKGGRRGQYSNKETRELLLNVAKTCSGNDLGKKAFLFVLFLESKQLGDPIRSLVFSAGPGSCERRINSLKGEPYLWFSLTSAPPPAPLWTSSSPGGGIVPFLGRTSGSCFHSIPLNLMKQNKRSLATILCFCDIRTFSSWV